MCKRVKPAQRTLKLLVKPDAKGPGLLALTVRGERTVYWVREIPSAIGGRRWEVIIGRGHSPEHAALWCRELDVLISGDQVLPRITTENANSLRSAIKVTFSCQPARSVLLGQFKTLKSLKPLKRLERLEQLKLTGYWTDLLGGAAPGIFFNKSSTKPSSSSVLTQ